MFTPSSGDDLVAPSRPRPLLTAAGKQAPLAIGGGILAGPAYLAALTQAGQPITIYEIAVAIVLTGGPLITSLMALWRAARAGEGHVTPLANPVDAAGRALQPQEKQVVDYLLDVELRRRQAEAGVVRKPATAARRSPPPDELPPAQRASGPTRRTPEEYYSPDYVGQRFLDDDEAEQPTRAARRHRRATDYS